MQVAVVPAELISVLDLGTDAVSLPDTIVLALGCRSRKNSNPVKRVF